MFGIPVWNEDGCCLLRTDLSWYRDARIIICCMKIKELEEESKSINKKKGEKGLMWRDESQRCNLERR